MPSSLCLLSQSQQVQDLTKWFYNGKLKCDYGDKNITKFLEDGEG